MKKTNILKGVKGFSLVEVLVFVTILSLFFITAVSITTFSLRNIKIQEHKILATRYAEDANEWIRQEKEDDWQVFISRGAVYCLNSLDWNTTTNCGENYTLGPPNIFKRYIAITKSGNPVDKVETSLAVSWLENGISQTVLLKSVFNRLE